MVRKERIINSRKKCQDREEIPGHESSVNNGLLEHQTIEFINNFKEREH